jgi:hypothetical protein
MADEPPKLGPRPDAQLAVDARKIGLDGFRADEQRRRHLAICDSGGREFRDALLLGGELGSSPVAAGAFQLRASALHP